MNFLVNNANRIKFFLVLCLIVGYALSYIYGFYPFPIWFWMGAWFAIVGLKILSYIFSGLWLVVLVFLIVQKEPFIKSGLIWLSLSVILVFVPGYYSEVAGALSAFHLAGADQVRAEANMLIQKCEQSSDKQTDCGYIFEYPPAIKRVNPAMVYISDTFIVIGKVGLIHPDGFMIFSDGDISTESMHIKKLGENLYWTYDN